MLTFYYFLDRLSGKPAMEEIVLFSNSRIELITSLKYIL